MYVCMYLQDQCTPLYIASRKGFNDVVKTLIAANANVNYICEVSYCQCKYLIYNYALANS